MRISDWSSDVCSSDLQADTASWFSGSADYEMDDSYKADYEEGRAAYDAEDYEDAVNRYGALAEAGVPEAAYELGKAYRYGNGVPKDTERAAQWLIAAVSRSHSRWPHASYHLGTMFKAGEGVPQDFALAARLLQQAADNGYLRANLPLAQLYASGQGVEKDLARARELALRSADSGDVESYRSEEHTSELQSLMRISYAVFCLKKKIQTIHI